MPKPFMLGIEVEEIALGKVMRVLNGMPGIVKLHMNLQSKGNSFKAKAPVKKFDMKGDDFIASLLVKHPMPTSDIRQHFGDVGRSPKSVNSQLSVMLKDGLIKKHVNNKDWMLTGKMKDRLRHRKPKDKLNEKTT